MCNCGNKRDDYANQLSLLSNGGTTTQEIKKMWVDVQFEYTGKTGLTVTGGVTGKRYRFTQTGAIQLIDYRDAGGMMGIPVLKKIKI